LPALVLLRKPLYGLAKRRQPRTLGASFTKSWVYTKNSEYVTIKKEDLMEIKVYSNTFFDDVFGIVHKTIEEIYSKYYSRSAVDFYHNLHSEENMKNQLSDEFVLVLMDNSKIFGTGAVLDNEIHFT
jgi:prenyltransferase beta subunit